LSTKPKPSCESARAWLRVRNGKGCLAFLTGGTSRAFSAYVHLVECWVHERSPESVLALVPVVRMFYSPAWPLLAEVIAHVGDWDHIEQLWTEIKPIAAPDYVYEPERDQVMAVLADWASTTT
jgi:hypothetical protein